jgi:hypothetical protein
MIYEPRTYKGIKRNKSSTVLKHQISGDLRNAAIMLASTCASEQAKDAEST